MASKKDSDDRSLPRPRQRHRHRERKKRKLEAEEVNRIRLESCNREQAKSRERREQADKGVG